MLSAVLKIFNRSKRHYEGMGVVVKGLGFECSALGVAHGQAGWVRTAAEAKAVFRTGFRRYATEKTGFRASNSQKGAE